MIAHNRIIALSLFKMLFGFATLFFRNGSLMMRLFVTRERVVEVTLMTAPLLCLLLIQNLSVYFLLHFSILIYPVDAIFDYRLIISCDILIEVTGTVFVEVHGLGIDLSEKGEHACFEAENDSY